MRVERAASTRVMAVQFDNDEALGDNQKFREAVAYAIDRDAIIKGLLRGYGVPAKSILSPGIPEWPSDKDFTRKHDLEKAKALVKELGLEGREIVMRTSSGRYPNDRETALAIGAPAPEGGPQHQGAPEEWGTFFEDLKNHKMSALYLSGQGNVWLDPYPQIEAFHTTKGLLSAWSDPKIDELLAKSNEVPARPASGPVRRRCSSASTRPPPRCRSMRSRSSTASAAASSGSRARTSRSSPSR